MSPDPVVSVRGLTCAQPSDAGPARVLSDVTLGIAPGEVFGLAGESGSGKSTLAHLLLGYRLGRLRVQSGDVRVVGQDVLAMPRPALDRLRGRHVALVPQNPTTALDPRLPVGRQVAEALTAHQRPAGLAVVLGLLAEVGLPEPARLAARYPHQLSGGQQQRAVLAMALACRPDLLVLDEPTTGLDVTTQARIIALLHELRVRFGMAMLYVTHDLGVMARIADRVGVLYAGHLVEIAPTGRLFRVPRHPYTRGLIASVPRLEAAAMPAEEPLTGLLRRAELPAGCAFAPRCPHAEPACAREPQLLTTIAADHAVACRRWTEIEPMTARRGASAPLRRRSPEPVLELRGLALDYRRGFRRGRQPALVDAIDLVLPRGETLALVGESGSGKSTIARAIAGLLPPVAGAMLFGGQALPGPLGDRSAAQRRAIQFVFQNPDASLNPRATIGETLGRPLAFFDRLPRRDRAARVAEALEAVQLDALYAARYPDELSGGERQRVAIARATIVAPALLLCDEVLSALDVSVQARILELLRRLRHERQQTMLFISHDLAVVRALADRVAVLYRGRLMQTGPTEAVFRPPSHPYTLALLRAVPDPDRPQQPLLAETPAAAAPGAAAGLGVVGCGFAGRCPWQRGALCETTPPPPRAAGGGAVVHCHIPLDELATLTAPPTAQVGSSVGQGAVR